MRRTILLLSTALVGGLVLGTLLGSGLFSAGHGLSRAASASVPMAPAQMTAASTTPVPLNTEANDLLLAQAGSVLELLKEKDYTALSGLIHPQKGVTLTPFSTVSTECDRTLTQTDVAELEENQQTYVWGVMDGSGSPIRSTCSDYFDRFVYNADYAQAPEVGVDTVLMSGNALENVSDAYPDARFVDYNFPGIDPGKNGYDWCSLKLVFEPWQNEWYLVGLIHSEWTT